MGFLHAGHLALVAIAAQRSEAVVASIFVNPLQFGPSEDLRTYPRDEAGDLQKLEEAGVDLVFLPLPEQIYPPGFQTTVHLSEVTKGLCSIARPHHFDGVATVVLKLFNIVRPQVAIFGEKDYQQLALIRQMVGDLNLSIEIVGAPIVRSPEGLALSSRNSYLSDAQKREALVLFRAIQTVQTLFQAGETRVSILAEKGREEILAAPSARIDYLEIVDALSLKPLERIDRPARFLLAVKIGKTRLLDNAPL